MQVSVKVPSGELLKLQVEANDTIDKIKEQLHHRLGLPPAQQLLIFQARTLEGSRTVTDYGLDRVSQPLYLVSRPQQAPVPRPAALQQGPRPKVVQSGDKDKRSIIDQGLNWMFQAMMPINCWPDSRLAAQLEEIDLKVVRDGQSRSEAWLRY